MRSKIHKLLNNMWFIVVFTVAVFSLTFLNKNKEAHAITQATLTGSCGVIFTANINGWEGVATHFAGTVTNNAIGTINFDSGKFGLKFSSVTPYGDKDHVDEVFANIKGDLTFSSFNSDTGIYEYTATDSNNADNIEHLSILPVNGGNTYLITAYTEIKNVSATTPVATGVCQKV